VCECVCIVYNTQLNLCYKILVSWTMCVCVYIYIYRERERCVCVCMYVSLPYTIKALFHNNGKLDHFRVDLKIQTLECSSPTSFCRKLFGRQTFGRQKVRSHLVDTYWPRSTKQRTGCRSNVCRSNVFRPNDVGPILLCQSLMKHWN
jgi:hypothetical protein